MPRNGEGRMIGVVTAPTLLSLYLLRASLSFRQLSFLIALLEHCFEFFFEGAW